MQYAKVVPNTATNLETQSFTYSIPAALLPKIKVGVLVKIPLGKRKIDGIITEITRKTEKSSREKIKPILSIINPEPLLDEIHIKLAKWMANYYFAPLSKCLFEMLPSQPKRKSSVVATTPFKIKAGLPAPLPNASILNICQQVLSKNKQIIVLFPEVKQANIFFSLLQNKFKRVGLYHGDLNKTERCAEWQKIKQGQADIVCGTRLALFTPLSRLGAIIITEEDSDGYKNERSPRYNAKTVAQKLSLLTSSKLILMSETPSVESHYHYHFSKQKHEKTTYLIRHPTSLPLHQSTTLIDMRNETKKGNFSPFSEILQAQLKRIYQEGKKAILFTARRGAASYIFCRHCGYVLRCPRCNIPLTYHLQPPYSNQLICHHCTFKTKPISICPNCQGIDFKFLGFGTQKLEAELKKLFIKPNILRIDKDLPTLPLTTQHQPVPLFIVGTQKLLSNWFLPVDLAAIVSIDNLLHLPDLNSAQKVFSIVTKLRGICLSLFYLQTYHPKNFIINSALTQKGWHKFVQNELENRKRLNLPPFSKLIRIIYQHKNETKCKRNIQIVADKIKPALQPSSAILFGPSPCFYSKIRQKYRWQIVLSLKTKNLRLRRHLFNLFKKSPKDWIIDVDPITLL